MNKNQLTLSVNIHLTETCNFHCGFCFAKYAQKEQQPFIVSHDNAFEKVIYFSGHCKSDNNFSHHSAVQNGVDFFDIIKSIADFGFKKISFAGGEPLLAPGIEEYIGFAKRNGLMTMLITNGSLLDGNVLPKFKGALDWIGLSIDSLNPKTNCKIGRASIFTEPFSGNSYYALCNKIRKHGFRLKINTVVNKYNLNENLKPFIQDIKPERWKVMQVLFHKDVNEKSIQKFGITNEQFWNFFLDNYIKDPNIAMIPEPEEMMRGSYLMVDPHGRLYDNSSGTYKYSRKILEVGIEDALKDIEFNPDLFVKRGGLYNY